MEMLDIVDENGEPTGKVVERELAHAVGVRHRTSHVWILRPGKKGIEVLLQKRSYNKDSNPGCYDISSAGHIPAGCGYVESALRELREELGLCASQEELHYCGKRNIYKEAFFHNKRFIDHQVSSVFYIIRDVEISSLTLQKSEVESVLWMPLDECMRRVKENSMKHCLFMEELEMLAGSIR